MEKLKLKRQRTVTQAPEKLILQQSFDFMTQLPLDECVTRIKFITREKAYISFVTPNKVVCNLQQWGTRAGGSVWSVLYIEEKDDLPTHVYGITGLSSSDFYLYLIVFVIAPLIFVLKYAQILACLWFIPLAGFLLVCLSIYESNTRTRRILLSDLQGICAAKRNNAV
jgi:hypothetical protein